MRSFVVVALLLACGGCWLVAGTEDFVDGAPGGQSATSSSIGGSSNGGTTAASGGGGTGGTSSVTSTSSTGGASSTTTTGAGGSADDRYVFLTPEPYKVGDFNSLATADQLCQGAATLAGLGGLYRAWLSDANVDAIDRFGDGRFILPGPSAKQVFASKSAIPSGPQVPIDVLPDGTPAPLEVAVWTGTNALGTSSAQHCDSWMDFSSLANVTMGSTGSVSSWTDSGTSGSCSTSDGHFYCFQDGP